MNYEIYGAYNQGGQDERGNGLNINTSLHEVKVIRHILQNFKDDGVYDDKAEAKRKNDDGAENKRKDWLKDEVEGGERGRNNDKAEDWCAQNESCDVLVREPEGECVASNNKGNPSDPVHCLIITKK